MLRFRRPAAAPALRNAETSNDRAQALLAMLGDDATALGLGAVASGQQEISDERLRSLARDLIAQVETRRPNVTLAPPEPDLAVQPAAPRDSTPDSEAAARPAAQMPRRSVFGSRAPLARPEPEPQPKQVSPPVAMTIASAASPAARPVPLHAPAEVRRLILEGLDPAAPGREHPGVIALTLIEKPPLEQAAALRQLPRGQVRGVHRSLRLLDMNALRP